MSKIMRTRKNRQIRNKSFGKTEIIPDGRRYSATVRILIFYFFSITKSFSYTATFLNFLCLQGRRCRYSRLIKRENQPITTALLYIVPDFRGLSPERSERFISGLERGNAKRLAHHDVIPPDMLAVSLNCFFILYKCNFRIYPSVRFSIIFT